MKFIIIISLIILLIYLYPRYKTPIVYKDVITEEERQHIIETARSQLKTSEVESDKGKIDHTIRVSETAWLDPKTDPVVKRVMQKCLSKCDRPMHNCEFLQVVRYKEGGFYKPHYDTCHKRYGCYDEKVLNNQRMYTFIIALNDEYKGGKTSFPVLNQSFKLKAGDILKFCNLNNYGYPTGNSLHTGTPVESGEKWICNVWVHTYPYL